MVENDAPMIRRLTIKRVRGHADFDWLPRPGLNVLVCGGDVGKTTVLDAISLLLTPSSSPRLDASDYFLQEVDQGFSIEAVFHLPDRVGINTLGKQVYPWQWDGEQARIPDIEGEQSPSEEEAVYVLRVRGTSDFEVFHEIVQPHGDPTYMPVGLRRRIGLVALAEDDDVDRDL